MKLFNLDKNNEKTIELLKKSQQDFRFDQDQVRARLMIQINSSPQSLTEPESKPRLTWSYASAFAIVIVFVLSSGTLAYANNSNPGDKLFFLDKLTERAVLALPMPAANKARIQTNIVAERLEEINKIEPEDDNSQKSLRAVSESETDISEAVANITATKEKLLNKGNRKAADKLDEVLNKLEGLAEKHESKAERAKLKSKDDSTKKELELKIIEIKKAREKAKLEILKGESDNSGKGPSQDDEQENE
jgi:hypothetical protein